MAPKIDIPSSSRHTSNKKQATSWSELPMELLCLIMNLLNVAEFSCLVAVCQQWRKAAKAFAATEENFSSRHLPWLVMARDPKTRSLQLIDRDLGKEAEQAVVRRQCCGSFGQWLVVCDDQKNVYIMHAFRRECFDLPSQTTLTIDGHCQSAFLDRPFYIQKAILSSPPTSIDCMIVIIFDHRKLAYCELDQTEWTHLEDYEEVEKYYQDIAFHSGELYAVDADACLTVFDLRSNETEILVSEIELSWPMIDKHDGLFGHYLVGSGSAQLLLVRWWRPEPGTDAWVQDCKDIMYEVLKVDLDTKGCVEIPRLGDQVLFLSFCNSVLLTASEVPKVCSSDAIYFTDDGVITYGDPVDMAVYSLSEKSKAPLTGEAKELLFFHLFNPSALESLRPE